MKSIRKKHFIIFATVIILIVIGSIVAVSIGKNDLVKNVNKIYENSEEKISDFNITVTDLDNNSFVLIKYYKDLDKYDIEISEPNGLYHYVINNNGEYEDVNLFFNEQESSSYNINDVPKQFLIEPDMFIKSQVETIISRTKDDEFKYVKGYYETADENLKVEDDGSSLFYADDTLYISIEFNK